MIETERLVLREWRVGDGATFAALTNTPSVMRYLGGVEDPAVLATSERRQRALQAERGYCFWIVERRADGAMLGFCGLKPCTVGPIDGEVEIGWRLREDAWGQGYAREAAQASLAWAWATLDAPRIVAMTVAANTASWGLMERLGMIRRPDLDFAHPAFAADHALSAHIVYSIDRPAI